MATSTSTTSRPLPSYRCRSSETRNSLPEKSGTPPRTAWMTKRNTAEKDDVSNSPAQTPGNENVCAILLMTCCVRTSKSKSYLPNLTTTAKLQTAAWIISPGISSRNVTITKARLRSSGCIILALREQAAPLQDVVMFQLSPCPRKEKVTKAFNTTNTRCCKAAT